MLVRPLVHNLLQKIGKASTVDYTSGKAAQRSTKVQVA